MFGGRLGADLSLVPRPLSERRHETRVDLANWWFVTAACRVATVDSCACVIRGPFFPVLYIYTPPRILPIQQVGFNCDIISPGGLYKGKLWLIVLTMYI